MSEPNETKPSDAIEPIIPPGESSGPASSGESLFAEDAESAGESRQPDALTTSTETARTTKRKTSSRSATAVTQSKGTKAERSALRAELMEKYGIKEHWDRGAGRKILYLNDRCTPEIIAEIRRLEK